MWTREYLKTRAKKSFKSVILESFCGESHFRNRQLGTEAAAVAGVLTI